MENKEKGDGVRKEGESESEAIRVRQGMIHGGAEVHDARKVQSERRHDVSAILSPRLGCSRLPSFHNVKLNYL